MGKLKSMVDRISTRVFGVLLLPVLATMAMVAIFAYGLQQEAKSLSTVRSDTEVLATLSELRTQLAVERTTTTGAVAIADFERSTSVDVMALFGDDQFDLATSMSDTRLLVDQTARRLPLVETGDVNEPAVRNAIDALVVNRQAIDADLGSAGPRVAVYNEYVEAVDRWIEEIDSRLDVSTTGLRGSSSEAVFSIVDNLQTLNETADQDLRLLVPLLVSGSITDQNALDQLIGNRAITQSLTDELDSSMPQQLRPAWRQFILSSIDGEASSGRIIEALRNTPQDEPLEIEALVAVATDFQPNVDRLQRLAGFQATVGNALIIEAAADEARANDDFVRLLILGAALLLFTVVSALLVARHLAQSMRQLGNAAEALNTGEFDAGSLPTRGPREVVDTARAFSTMTDTLRAVDAHATAIATGKASSVELLSAVPGHIGESLRSSLLRVEDMAEQLRHDANHDALTGLSNRAGAIEQLEALLSAGPQTLITTMFIDLDRFKRVNDTFGHHIGDALLTAAGFRLQHRAGTERTVARLGGDEFLLVADDLAGEAAAIELAEQLASDLDKAFSIDDRVLSISASIGIAQEMANGQTVADILRNADMAAYEAKRHRSKSVVFSDDSLLEAAMANLKLEEDLRGAWTRGEMSLYLQPLVLPDSGQPASAEALMRWVRPDGTMIPPDVFIPIAEDTGMIVAIDEWMVDQAARQIALWERIGHPAGRLRIAVNISGQHFTEGDLVHTVTEACRDNGILAEQLVIEVTESCAVGDISNTVAVLEELREMGVAISLDDFGTGYSSLSYLQQLPIDTVKIDRSFVKGLPLVDANAKIVELVATLSSVLELAVVAEGVETSDQASCLEDLGIHYLQGYYFAKPMEAAAFSNWVEQLSIDDPFAGNVTIEV